MLGFTIGSCKTRLCKRSIDQYLCNEKEFGFQLHLKQGKATKEEEKEFKLAGAEKEVTPVLLDSLFSSYYSSDPYLEEYVKKFNFENYLIFRVQNKNLYYVDDIPDYMKHHIIKQGGNWESSFLQHFEKYVKPGSTVVDIGGHIGTHTLTLSQIVGEQGTVHVFEPQMKIFCELAINLNLNNCKNVQLHHQALGAEEKWIEMYIPKEDWYISKKERREKFDFEVINEGHGTVKTFSDNPAGDRSKMVRLDDLHLDQVSFMKIDVEGFELEVVKGALETIERNKPVMIIEIFKGPERLRKIQEIENLGYISSLLDRTEDDYLFFPLSRLELLCK